MDAFSEVLSGVRLKGAMFFSAAFSAPWRLSTPHCRVLAPALAPGAPHIVVYHLVMEGTAHARVDGGHDVELSPGDIVVFPHGDPHHLSAGSGTNPVESAALLQRIAAGDLSPMQAGGYCRRPAPSVNRCAAACHAQAATIQRPGSRRFPQNGSVGHGFPARISMIDREERLT